MRNISGNTQPFFGMSFTRVEFLEADDKSPEDRRLTGGGRYWREMGGGGGKRENIG